MNGAPLQFSAGVDGYPPQLPPTEREAPAALPSLQLPPERPASVPAPAPGSASSSLTSSLLLHRSSSLPHSPALPEPRPVFHAEPPQQQELLYNTEVRSCGHPTPLYVKVPVNSAGAAPVPPPSLTSAAAVATPPLAPATAAGSDGLAPRVATRRVPPPPPPPPAPYAAESARASVRSEALPPHGSDGGRTPASPAPSTVLAASPHAAARVVAVDEHRDGSDGDVESAASSPDVRAGDTAAPPAEDRDAAHVLLLDPHPAVRPFAFLYAATTTSATSSVERQQLSDTEDERNVDVDVNPDTAAAEAAAPAPPGAEGTAGYQDRLSSPPAAPQIGSDSLHTSLVELTMESGTHTAALAAAAAVAAATTDSLPDPPFSAIEHATTTAEDADTANTDYRTRSRDSTPAERPAEEDAGAASGPHAKPAATAPTTAAAVSAQSNSAQQPTSAVEAAGDGDDASDVCSLHDSEAAALLLGVPADVAPAPPSDTRRGSSGDAGQQARVPLAPPSPEPAIVEAGASGGRTAASSRASSAAASVTSFHVVEEGPGEVPGSTLDTALAAPALTVVPATAADGAEPPHDVEVLASAEEDMEDDAVDWAVERDAEAAPVPQLVTPPTPAAHPVYGGDVVSGVSATHGTVSPVMLAEQTRVSSELPAARDSLAVASTAAHTGHRDVPPTHLQHRTPVPPASAEGSPAAPAATHYDPPADVDDVGEVSEVDEVEQDSVPPVNTADALHQQREEEAGAASAPLPAPSAADPWRPVPAARAWGTETAAQVEPAYASRAGAWRWPPSNRGVPSVSQTRLPVAWASSGAAALFRQRPVARDLMADVDVSDDDGARGGADAEPQQEPQQEAAEDTTVCSPWPPEAAGPTPATRAHAAAVDRLVQAHRRVVASAPLDELVALEQDGRRQVMYAMLQDRQAVLHEEAAAYAVVTLPRMPPPPAASAGARTRVEKAEEAGMLRAHAAWVPPLPPSPLGPSHQLLHGAARSSQSAAAALLATFTPPPPTSRAEVERLLRTRGVSSGASLGFVSAALFADELLRREVVEDAETGARAMLHRLCQCDSDAMNPYNLVVQEMLARQRLIAAEQLDRQRARSLQNSPAADVSELLSIGRELAMCRIMEEDERHEVIERAEAQARQRLRELHWRGLAARLRQRELTWASMDVALRSALDDVVFDETQAREEVRVEAIRALTELLESASGAAVRHAQQQQRVQQRHLPKQLTANMTSMAKNSERRDVAAAAAAAAETEVTHATVQAQWPTQKRSAVVACDHTAPAAAQHAAEEEVDWELVEDVVEELDEIIATPDAPVLEAAPANGASSPSVSSSVSLPGTPCVRPLARPTDAVASATTSAGAAAAAAAAAATLAAAANFATVAAAAHSGTNSAGPDMQRFFEWDPTSNSASLQRPPRPSEDANAAHAPHSSASSPSPHLTNMTVMTTTGNTTANATGTTTKTTTATTTTTTTSSSRNAAGRVRKTHDTTAAAPAPSANAAAVAVADTSSSESRRSPTTLLQSYCDDQQHKGVSSAELSALMNALRTSEAAVTAARHGARSSGAPTTQQQSADPRAAAALADAGVREGADEDSPREEQVEAHVRPSAPRVESPDDVADVSATAASSPSASPPPPARLTATAAAVKGARVVNRHTVPCSLCRSPGLGYAALLRRYAPEQLDQSPLPSPALSLSPSSSSGRHYADSDVYAYDALHTRHAGPPTRPTALGPLPWERLQVLDGLYEARDDVNAVAVHADDSTAGAATVVAVAAPGVVSPSELSLVTPARAIFPDLRRPWSSTRRRTSPFASILDADRPAAARRPPLQQQQQLVLEVVTARRSAGASSAPRAASSGGVVDDVTVSPMSSALRESRSRSESPSRTHPAAAWVAAHLHEEPLTRGALMHAHAHRDESDAVGGAREHQLPHRPHNLDQSSCSRRRCDTATSAGTSAPLLITRLPLECGPGVWMSASSDGGRRGVRHVLATTTPPRTRPPPTTLSGAVAEAARAGDAVVRLPTTVAELLGVPQHTRLPLGDAGGDPVDVNREQRRRGSATAAVRPHASPYSYVDVFYRNKTPVASTVHPQPSRSTPARSPPSKTHDTAAAFVAARCSAVERREVVHELRQVLRAPTPSTSPRSHRLECSAKHRDPQSQRRRASHASSASTAVLAADSVTPTKGDVGDDVAQAEECCFDAYDDATAVLRSVAAVTHAGRQRRRHSRASTVMSPAPSPALPPPPPVTRRASGSADVARPRRASALAAPPPPSLPLTPSRDAERLATSYRVLPAPSPSFELTPHSPRRLDRSALSPPSSAAAVATAARSSSTARSSLAHPPSTAVVAAVIASRWGGAAAAAVSPTRTQPLRQWHPLGQGRVPSPRRRASGSISATEAAPMRYVTFV